MKKILISIIPISLLILAGCSNYYSSDITGFVRDGVNNQGINGARIRMYSFEPVNTEEDGYIVETFSFNYGDEPGYFDAKIIWDNPVDTFGDAGASWKVWIAVTHKDYSPIVVLRAGLLSDTRNMISDIILERASFPTRTIFSTSLQGRCMYRLGTAPNIQEIGINGVDVTLTYTDDNGAHVIYTQTDSGGYYAYFLEWEEDPPVDNGSGIIIPTGEDVLMIDLDFTSNSGAGNIYSFDSFTSYVLKSWLDPNILPDRVDTNPNG